MTDARALEIVEMALGEPDPAVRAHKVAQACGSDEALRARVEQLLAMESTEAEFPFTESFVRAFALDDVIAERIGAWRVTGQIARGGMGTVVRAERADGLFRQDVAIKLIRRDIASDAARLRFAEERRILARLSHPAIVRIVDGGEHVDHPWLAMDFVDGLPITQGLEAKNASRSERMAAFRTVCEAVAHAHRALVVHADIKPSNVMLDRDGQVHLLDFGIARLIDDLDAETAGARSLSTEPSPLTRAYAAPERAGGAAPTVSGDVFSLGMLFAEIMAGRSPVGDLPRETGTMLPCGWLEGDLGAIARRALAIAPEHRYPDVTALIEDLRRLDQQLPLAALSGAGWTYHSRLFMRRHAAGLAVATALFVALAGAAATSTVFYLRAEAERTEADARFADARAVARALIERVLPRLETIPGSLRVQAETAAVAQVYLERLAESPHATDPVRIEAADGLLRLARFQARAGSPNLAQPQQAARNLDRARTLLAPLQQVEARELLARVHFDRAWLDLWKLGDQKGAELATARGVSIYATLSNPTRTMQLARMQAIAELASWQGDFATERRNGEAGLALIGAPQSADEALMRFRFAGYRAESIYQTEGAKAALPFYAERAAMVEDFAHAGVPQGKLLSSRTIAWHDLASTHLELGNLTEARAGLARARAAADAAVARDVEDAEAVRRLRVIRNAQAQVLARAGEIGPALAQFAAVRADDARLLRQSPSPERARDLAYDHTLIGEALDHAGRRDAACAADGETAALYAELSRKGMLTAFDRATNLREVEKRIARNCPR
ncbi:protein kinase domain-containing protein [Novosphingobium cyanobacteriorum]|uniref:Serine/threonine-protein kinase n=1 Tax=Novosphingobium cyanobacteriorum TaxID=3024215 RepID=A0ABT6CIS5_9SPHN|nr:serine/threonine-protein kinase [Novosphingobium cyanobacteriorum]MDF8333820.1 serine/threonine-protein kinase [Novosphingobium cyanobacteriorum]